MHGCENSVLVDAVVPGDKLERSVCFRVRGDREEPWHRNPEQAGARLAQNVVFELLVVAVQGPSIHAASMDVHRAGVPPVAFGDQAMEVHDSARSALYLNSG